MTSIPIKAKHFLTKNFRIQNIFNISSLLKLSFLYFTIVIYIIIFDFHFSSYNFSDFSNKEKIAIYNTYGRIGEGALFERIKKTLKKEGYFVISASFSENYTSFILTKHFYFTAASLVNLLSKPKFTLAVTHHFKVQPLGALNLVYLNVPSSMLIDENNNFIKPFNYLYNYDGFIDINSFARSNNNWLTETLKNHHNKFIIPAYLAYPKVKYKPTEKKKILITGSLWGCGRNSPRIRKALKMLADDNILDAFGLEDDFKFLNAHYKGRIKHQVHNSLKECYRKYGIGLVLHNLDHIAENIPTNRIIETVASGAVVITDRHPFIEKYFKDTVFYIDTNKTPEEIYNQVLTIYKYIQNNPIIAEKMATHAFQTFINNFTLEANLGEIIKSTLKNKEYLQ